MAFANSCEILSLLWKGRYFRGVITLGTLQYYDEMPLCLCLKCERGISHVIISIRITKTNSLKVQSSSFILSSVVPAKNIFPWIRSCAWGKEFFPIIAYTPPQAWKESAFLAVELLSKPGTICQ